MLNWTYTYNPQRRGRNRFPIEQKDVPFEAKMAFFEALNIFVEAPTLVRQDGPMIEYHARDAAKAR